MNVFGVMKSDKGKSELETAPEDIPKEDLLNLCMKLNKRMKLMEMKGQDMLKKYNAVLAERNSLVDLIVVATDAPLEERNVTDINHVKDLLFHKLNCQNIINKELKDKVDLLEGKLASRERFQESNSVDKQVIGSESRGDSSMSTAQETIMPQESIQEKDNEITRARKKKETMMLERDAELHIDSRCMSDSAQIQECPVTLAHQSRKKSDNGRDEKILARPIIAIENESDVSSLLKAEQDALLIALRKELAIARQAKDISDKKAKEFEEYRIRMEGKLRNFNENREKLSCYETDLEEANAMIRRLQGCLHTKETDLAVCTAEMACAKENQRNMGIELANLQQELTDVTIKKSFLEQQVGDVNKKAKVEKDSLIKQIADTKAELNNLIISHKEAVSCREQHFEKLIHESREEFTRRCRKLELLCKEKDETICVLIKKNSLLMEEIESGHPAERKIFELASRQASREANLQKSRDAREVAFQQLQTSLAAKDLELASLQDTHRRLLSEVSELRCVKNRETVNMDYLKNIILQYMSFPSSSPERAGLVPVISLLLQFNEEEVMQATSGLSRTVKEVKVHPSHNVNGVMSAIVHNQTKC